MTNDASAKRSNRAICVYCGSASGSDPVFAVAARTLGTAMAAGGIDLVYGGGGVGLMGEVARAVIAGGGHVIGIIPEFLKAREVHFRPAQELIVTKDMHERKMLMFERADAFVALPGGIGTLEELIEQMTWAQLGQHRKPIVMANIAGFWSPLLTLMQHMQDTGFLQKAFIPASKDARYHVVEQAAEIVPCISRLLADGPDRASDSDIAHKF